MNYTKERDNLIDVQTICLQSIAKTLNIHGVFFKIGAEFEFYLIPKNYIEDVDFENIVIPLSKEYQNYQIFTYKSQLIKQISNKLQQKMMEFDIKISDIEKEDGRNQFEIHFPPSLNAVILADSIVRFKKYAKEICNENGFHFVISGKPFEKDSGNSMHIHISLYNHDSVNIFQNYDEFSELINYAIGGIMENAKSMLYLCGMNDENSYYRFKRPIFGQIHKYYPTNFSFGINNRTCMIRIPFSNQMNMQDARIEFRLPCPVANPYNLFSGLYYSIAHGISNSIIPINPIYGDAFDRKYDSILEIIPKNLKDAQEMYYGSKVSSVINGKINDFINILYLKSNSYLMQ